MMRPRALGGGASLGAAGQRLDLVGIDADREGVGGERAVEDPDRGRRSRSVAAGDFSEIAAEVRGIPVGLEADEIEGAEAAGEALVLGERGEDLGRRERDVQEEAHAALPARGAHLLAHQEEVVVVHPDGVVGAGELGEEAGEAAVDRLVGGEVGLVEMREVDPVVEDRPERAVGVAEVVALVLGLGQVGEGELDVAFGEEPDAAGLALDGLAGPAEPDAAAALRQRLLDRHRQPAGARGAGARDAVRGDDQASRHGGIRTPGGRWQGRNVRRAAGTGFRRGGGQARAAAGSRRASARIAVSTATWRWIE